MSRAYSIALADGTREEVQGFKFSHYVQNIRFWFFCHKRDGSHVYTISEFESGKAVATIDYFDQFSGKPIKDLAKARIDALVVKHGATRVRSILAGATGGQS